MAKEKPPVLPALNRHPSLRFYLSLASIFFLLLLTSLACNITKKNGGFPQPVAGPFTAEDCNIPGMPPPQDKLDEIYPANIYCAFQSGGSLKGVMYFSLSYSAKVDDAIKNYGGWHDNIVENYSDYTAITDTLEELFVMKVTNDWSEYSPYIDVAAVQIYEQHFVILIKGALSSTSESAAQGLVITLFNYGMGIADDHYPGYH